MIYKRERLKTGNNDIRPPGYFLLSIKMHNFLFRIGLDGLHQYRAVVSSDVDFLLQFRDPFQNPTATGFNGQAVEMPDARAWDISAFSRRVPVNRLGELAGYPSAQATAKSKVRRRIR
jgi:hypothetical protein